MSVPQTTAVATIVGSTGPFPIVDATWRPKRKAAAKLKNAAQRTARRGVSTRVETTVAIEFAASFQPLMKSKTRASATRRTMVVRGRLLPEGSVPRAAYAYLR